MTIKIKKVLILMMCCVMIFVNSGFSYAASFNKNDIKFNLKNGNTIWNGKVETIQIEDKLVTYTFGENSVTVDNGENIDIVTYDEDNDKIFVNGNELKSIKNSPIINDDLNLRTIKSEWIEAGLRTGALDVGKLALDTVIAVISIKLGMAPTTLKRAILDQLKDYAIGDLMPDIFYISWEEYTYYKNINQPRPDMKIETLFYTGQDFDDYLGKTTIYS